MPIRRTSPGLLSGGLGPVFLSEVRGTLEHYLREMKKTLKKYDIFFIILIFVLTVFAEYREIFSLLEDQTLFLRHATRSTLADRRKMVFPYDKIVLVTVDEAFFAEYGKSPLRRSDLAKIVTNLKRLGAKVICVDLLLDLPGAYGEDPVLARSLAQSNAVLASQALFDRNDRFQKLNYPASLLKKTSVSGYINLTSPSSSVTFLSRLRIYPQITCCEDGWPIAVRAVSEYLGVSPVLREGRLLLGSIEIPLDQHNDIYIDFSTVPAGYRFVHELAGITAFEFLNISDLNKNEMRELRDWVGGKIVILGETSAVSPDWFDTPVGMTYGCEIIADTVKTLLRNGPLRPAPLAAEILISFIFLGILVLFTTLEIPPRIQFLFAAIVFTGFIGFTTGLYVWQGIIISMIYNLLAGCAVYVTLSLSFYFREKKLRLAERRRKEEAEREREAAQAASQAKTEFLANMSHELRTPLNAILGFSQLIGRDSALSAEHRQNLGIISQSGEHLLALINQVLSLSQIEAGRMTLDERDFNLYHLLNEILEMFRVQAWDKGLALTFERDKDVPQHIRTDETKLRQVLINLLNNAIKFTSEGRVSLHVRKTDGPEGPASENQTFIRFEVRDTGPGIAPEEMGQLFEAFVQTRAGQEARIGTGLGLSISHKYTELMGGRMTAESEIGQGATFSFYIRAEQTAAPPVPSRTACPDTCSVTPGHRPYRVLISDDRQDNRELLVRMLTPLNVEIREAADGQETVKLWKAWQPHLIWMDIRMPVMDGYEATQYIRNSQNGQASVIIAVTANAFEEEQAAVLSEGFDDLLQKPFRESEILELMRKYMEGCHACENADTCQAGADLQPISPISVIPPELLSKLEHAAIRADMIWINRLIDDIRLHDPVSGDRLDGLAHDFEYIKILEWIQKVGEK